MLSIPYCDALLVLIANRANIIPFAKTNGNW
jgi:hypothetical protein